MFFLSTTFNCLLAVLSFYSICLRLFLRLLRAGCWDARLRLELRNVLVLLVCALGSESATVVERSLMRRVSGPE